jgi:RNA-binding protein NOB1
MTSKKAKKLVVDTNAFIKAVRLETIGQEFFTIPQVIEEVRDARARQFLANFPFPIVTKDPSPAAMKAVAAFARKTGDYAFLSAADLRVLALVYTMEVEAKGSAAHLRTEPLKVGAVPEADKEGGKEGEKEGGKEEGDEAGEKKEDQQTGGSTQDETTQKQPTDTPSTETPGETSGAQKEAEEGGSGEEDGEGEGEGEGEEQKEDDDDGWITPDNIAIVRAKRGKEDELQAEEVDVGCFTTDYAMQSVLLQMGLKLLSVEGMVIKRIRQFVLKCYGCFTICKDMERKFCPKCGNNTLLRFSASTDENGNVTYTQAQRLTTRGTIYSIPFPKGGRNSNDLILSEDQYLHKTRYKRDPKTADVFASDYAFAQSKVGPKNNVVVGYGNKNPNVAKRRIGKKNKAITTM